MRSGSLAHWCDSHVQLPEWSDYQPRLLAAQRPLLSRYGGTTRHGHRSRHRRTDRPILTDPICSIQPTSSLVQVNSGDRVLLRFVNLGFIEQSMRLPGIPLRIVGKDATLLRGRSGNDLSYYTDTIMIGAGESVDAIFVAPDVTEMTTLLLANRNYARLSNGGAPGIWWTDDRSAHLPHHRTPASPARAQHVGGPKTCRVR